MHIHSYYALDLPYVYIWMDDASVYGNVSHRHKLHPMQFILPSYTTQPTRWTNVSPIIETFT